VARAIALPLYPHFCAATTGSSLNDLRRRMKWAGCSFPLTEIRSYPEHPKYVAALAETVASVDTGRGTGRDLLLFSAHGVPQSLIDAGTRTGGRRSAPSRAVMRSFPGVPTGSPSRAGGVGEVAFPRHGGRGDEAREGGSENPGRRPGELRVRAHRNAHELDIRLSAHARRAGIQSFLRAPALNDAPLFISALKDLVLGAA